MANLFWKAPRGTKTLLDRPFKTEEEFERTVRRECERRAGIEAPRTHPGRAQKEVGGSAAQEVCRQGSVATGGVEGQVFEAGGA